VAAPLSHRTPIWPSAEIRRTGSLSAGMLERSKWYPSPVGASAVPRSGATGAHPSETRRPKWAPSKLEFAGEPFWTGQAGTGAETSSEPYRRPSTLPGFGPPR
jgi:hypothetical protein